MLRLALFNHLTPSDHHALSLPHSIIATTNTSELVLGPCSANADTAERALGCALMNALDAVAPLRKVVLYSLG